MFVKIPTDFPSQAIDDFCSAWSVTIQRVDEFANFPDSLPIVAVCDLAARNGYSIGHTALGSLKFHPMPNADKNRFRPPPLTRKQILALKENPTPVEVHREMKAAESELANTSILSQDEIDSLLQRPADERFLDV
ncbi:hypothetical protein [uncultured Paraglaciecola sp.]|uniref:hypothetical protein n=1 Tax=uncultured Paraglaciecola sp. TaxID=1765024 RepID=UPI00260E0334|nr:hypothetical protein [uncultured Paraglaciecola sp.]